MPIIALLSAIAYNHLSILFMSGINNAHLFATTGIDTFPKIKAVIELRQAVKERTKSCLRLDMNFRKLVTAVTC